MNHDLQAMYSAILSRGRRSAPTYNEVSRDVRSILAQRARILY